MAHIPQFWFVTPDLGAFLRDASPVARALIAAGNDVTLAAERPRDPAVLDAVERLGAGWVDVPVRAGARGPQSAWRDAATAAILIAQWEQRMPDVVHATGTRTLPAVGAACRVRRPPFVFATLDYTPAEVGEPLVPGPLRRFGRASELQARAGRTLVARLGAQVDRFVALHRGLRDAWATGEPALPASIELLDSGLGIDVEDWLSDAPRSEVRDAARAALGWQSERFLWGTAPSACDASVAARLNRIADELVRAMPHVRVVVIASNADHGAMLRRVLSRPVFLHAEASARRDALLASDVWLQAEASVAFARAVMEAGASRIPAIVSDAEGHRAIVRPGANGQLAALDDAAAYVQCLRGVLDDAVVREEAGARARSYAVRLFDRDLATSKVLGFYDGLFRERVGEPLHLTLGGELTPASALEGGVEEQVRRVRELLGRG